MLEYLKKKYVELIASVLDPVFKWILARTWLERTALVLALPLVWTIWETRSQIGEHIQVVRYAFRGLMATSNTIPISNDLRDQLIVLRDRLRSASARDAALISTKELTGWSAAQSALATAGDKRFSGERDSFSTYMRSRQIPSCSCWAELNSEGADKAWIFISGWALAALASDNTAASSQEVNFILDNQLSNGSWLPTPGVKQEFSSVYTTAWNIIGLRAQLDAGLLDKTLSERAAKAIDGGRSWLLQKRLPGARWKAYPELSTANPSPTLSGLAIHALKVTSTESIRDLYREWLDGLPPVPIPVTIGENVYVEMLSQSGVKSIDHFVQITLPWMLVATTDAYAEGSVMQRAKATRWIESQIKETGLMGADTESKHWWRAEVSIAVNYLALNIARDAIASNGSTP